MPGLKHASNFLLGILILKISTRLKHSPVPAWKMWPISLNRTQEASVILISLSYFYANISKLELENSFLEKFYLSNFWIRNFGILHHFLHKNCPPICKNLSMSGNHHLFDFKLYKTTDGTVENNLIKISQSEWTLWISIWNESLKQIYDKYSPPKQVVNFHLILEIRMLCPK